MIEVTKPLADVVEQASQIEHGDVIGRVHQLGEFREGPLVLPKPKPPQLLDQEDRMNVHRIRVVHDVLPSAHDVFPLRQKPSQQADLVHHHQRAHHTVFGIQDLEKDLPGGVAGAIVFVDQVQVLTDQSARLPGQPDLVLLGNGECRQQQQRILSQQARMGYLEATTSDAQPVGHLLDVALLGPADPLGRLLHDQRRVVLDGSCVPVVGRHETLDRKLLALILGEAKRQRHFLLQFEIQLVVLAPDDQVQLVANAPEKVEGCIEFAHFIFRQKTEMQKIFAPPGARLGHLHHPTGQVIIAKRARTLLQVRLQQIQGITITDVAFFLSGYLFLDKLEWIGNEFLAKRILELVKQDSASRQEARCQNGRTDGHVAARQINGFTNRAGGGTDCQGSVPQPVLNALGDGGNVGRNLLPIQEQQVDIGADIHLATCIATGRHHAEPGNVFLASSEIDLFRELEQSSHQSVHQIRVGLVHLSTGGPTSMQLVEMSPGHCQVVPHITGNRGGVGRDTGCVGEVVVDPRGGHCGGFERASRVARSPR